MPAINFSVTASDPSSRQLIKRGSNWASRNVGVTLVFCIVFVIAGGLIGLFLYRSILARKARRAGNA